MYITIHCSSLHAQIYIWSYRTVLNKCSFYILQQQFLYTSRNSQAIRNVYLWFYLFYSHSVSKWMNYILLAANEMKILIRLCEFNEHILPLTYIFSHISITKTIWWLIVTCKSCEGVSNYSVCNTVENQGFFLQNRFSAVFCHSKWKPAVISWIMCGIATGHCPWKSSYYKYHTLCQPAQGPKPEEGNDTAVKGSKARNLASGKHTEEISMASLSTAWHNPL